MYFKSLAIFCLFIFNRPEGKSEQEHYGRAENNTLASTTNLSQQLHSICQDQREGAPAGAIPGSNHSSWTQPFQTPILHKLNAAHA